MIESISAITLATHHMPTAVRFYRALGFAVRFGGEEDRFTTLHAGATVLNLIAQPDDRRWRWWGRVILYVSDVDAFHEQVVAQGLSPDAPPRDAPWGERYFHLSDPDGHQLSFAKPLQP